jgi:hypothetical protein
VDGVAVAKQFEKQYLKQYKLLCEVDLDWKYFDGMLFVCCWVGLFDCFKICFIVVVFSTVGKSHLHCRAPVITINKTTGRVNQIRWNHYDRGDCCCCCFILNVVVDF